MRHLLLPILLTLSLFGCEDKERQIEEMQAQVMEVHDEAMAKIDEIYAQMSALKTAMSDSSNKYFNDDIRAAIDALQVADDKMMDWMHEWKAPKKGANPDQSIGYLYKEQQRIDEVAERINSSLANASKLLGQLNGKENE